MNFQVVATEYPRLTVADRGKGVPLIPNTGDFAAFVRFYGVTESGAEGKGAAVVPHLQRALTQFHNGIVRHKILDKATPQEIARLEACRARNASTWLQPTPPEVRPISNAACRMSHKLRLGIPTYDTVTNLQCSCGTVLKDGGHLLGCVRVDGGELTLRHDRIKKIQIKKIFEVNGRAVDMDRPGGPKFATDGSKERPDIEAWIGGTHMVIDVKVVHPTSFSYIGKALEPLGAALSDEKLKEKKHGSNAEKRGILFVPYVVETFGGWRQKRTLLTSF